MIAISVKQPWANLIASGRKTIETRTWSTAYRGQLLICAGLSVDAAAMVHFGAAPATWEQQYATGVALAVVQLVDVSPMKQEDEVAACCPRRPGLFAWRFGPIVATVRPFPVRGQLGLFKVEVPERFRILPQEAAHTETQGE